MIKFYYQNNRGFLLMLVFLVVFLLLLMALYFFSFIITELKISKNQSIAEQCYYLAEGGIEETIWKLKYDTSWKTNFENGTCNPCSFSRDPIFFDGGAYSVSLQSSGEAKGEITAVGTYTLLPSDITAQRIVKIKAFKAQEDSFTPEIALYTGDGDVYTLATDAEIINGGIFSNDNISVNLFSDVHTTETASASGDVDVCWLFCSLWAEGSEGEGSQEGWPPIEMPMIDFDSSDSNSYKNRANHVYTQNQFKQMMDDAPGGVLTVNGIIYVTGQVKVKRGTHLIINGTLVTDGSITIGIGGWPPSGSADVTVTRSGLKASDPSGLLTKGSIDSGIFGGSVDVTGLLYASDQVTFTNLDIQLDVTGGIITRHVSFVSLFDKIDITYDYNIIQNTLGGSAFSPVVTVEHWEEEY